MKYLSPLLLAYEDRMNEKDALLQSTEVKRFIHVCVNFNQSSFISPLWRIGDAIPEVGAVN